MPESPIADTYRSAARTLVELVAAVPADRWDDLALGTWTVRTLVGHAGRALRTVADYGAQAAGDITVPDAAAYFAFAASLPASTAAGIDERAVRAGHDLGDDPVGALLQAFDDAEPVLRRDPASPIATFAGVMPLGEYLRTRVLELVAHGLDLSTATGVTATFSPQCLRAAIGVAADIAVDRGLGPQLVLQLCGRATDAPAVVAL